MALFSQTPGKLEVKAVLGNDFLCNLNFDVTISDYEFDAGIILQEFPSKTIFPISVIEESANKISLQLSALETETIGVISNRKWFLNWSIGGAVQTILSGMFQISDVPIGLNQGQDVDVSVNFDDVNITISSVAAVGATGATGIGATGATGATGIGFDSSACIIAQAGDDLIAKFAEAVALEPNGDILSATNRASLVIFPGSYTLSAELAINEEYVDIIGFGSQTQKPAVFILNNTINIIANDVRVSGISVGDQIFKITGDKPSQVFENCTGGDGSFGGNGGFANGIFTNCIGGDGSFGNNGGFANGIFTNCIGGQESFGAVNEATAGGIFTNCIGDIASFGGGFVAFASGTFINCTGGDGSFGGNGMGIASGTFKNCTGGTGSFGDGSASLTGSLFYCKTAGTFPTPTGTGIIHLCIDGNNDVVNAQVI
jgi:hypothetical protein